ncbi:N-acetylmuramoyl-L-alanine amidase [Nocardioides donggukensis]|uniref:N-acetylmuramoyl-L-alanine amidase n=1 Tax=Nocardioides donggukensis TaxID=2774019 RepID=A0A927PYT8_9ACTN|nr:N-acetylmuramoyl-L-alanine amidase [Nocardioides donggukensis]MBD8868903.1 N-acetylmuramoyl-L-alanine amidase [Nocardioides donggukensis]
MPRLLGQSRSLPARAGVLLLSSTIALTGLGPAAHGMPAAPAAYRTAPIQLAAGDPGDPVRQATVRLGVGRLQAAGTGARTGRLGTAGFSQVALTWAGPDPDAEVRVRREQRWSGWMPLPELADGRPTTGRASDLLWVGSADGVQVRTASRTARDLELVLIDPGTLPSDDDAAPIAARTGTTEQAREAAPTRAPAPDLRGRPSWGADGSWRNGKPVYMKRIKQVHLHHTATANDYSRSEVPGLIRGMYRYHTQTLGWFDIGYNFLVDRFGRAWVGRSGGHAKRVRGAHTLGFNHASTGIALIGTDRAWKKAKTTIVRLAAWKLDKEGRDADVRVSIRSKGSDKYPSGRVVRLPAIDGHRDTNDTACPGTRLYDRLPGIRSRSQRRIDRF